MQSVLADAYLDIAERFGTPTYVYDLGIVRKQCQLLKHHLRDVPCDLLYAMKANANPSILQVMRDEGLGIDAVSPAEMLVALQLGFAPEHVLFSANNMTDAEMHSAHQAGVLLNIGELSRLERYGHAYPGSAVSIRLNPQIGAGHHDHVITGGAKSKFGIPVDEAEAIKSVAQRYGLAIVGLHQHIGSGILNTEVLWQAIEVMLQAAEAFPSVRILNFGGGLGVPYRPDEAAFDFENFRARIVEPLLSFKDRHPNPDLQYRFEPGRFLVAQSGVLLAEANTVKSANGRTFVGTDTGMNHLIRPGMYGAYHHIVNLSNPSGNEQAFDVVGNICESTDVFARDRQLAEVREGDVLAFLDAGAYGFSMASDYNLRSFPAEVIIDGGEVILSRERESAEDYAERFLQAYDAFARLA
ncbi:MAG: diaminopimelate decarboxylase [Bacteroidota bacterium]